MRAFRVSLNGKRICVAGVGEHGVLNASVDYVGNGQGDGRLSLRVGGLSIPSEEHATWKRVDLKVESVDRPAKLSLADSETYETNQKAYVRAWAKKFGWKIVRSKKSTPSKPRRPDSRELPR
ncbi:MAG TPA: hypothetical protein VGG72_10540 [Bryobacteraceae bacterium]|jgi:hypothetical protein